MANGTLGKSSEIAPNSHLQPHRLLAHVGMGCCKGSFGELLQGQTAEADNEAGADFLVTLPINISSRALFQIDASACSVDVFPAQKTKTSRFANRLIEEMGLCGGFLIIRSEIIEGKGCASSSADMFAAARAIGQAFNVDVPIGLAERLMLEIEPTDGVMYDECILYRFKTTGFDRALGMLPKMVIAALDEPGCVDTLAYDMRRHAYPTSEREEYTQLLERITDAVSRKDLGDIGRVATRSAELNQSRLPKRHFNKLVEIADEVGALGVVAAHSGTVLGVMLDPNPNQFQSHLFETFDRLRSLDGEVTIFENF